jgi:phosphomannomutase / phosphoglucomutase
MKTFAPEIFKAYDIRGIVDKTLTAEVVHAIGYALGTMALERKCSEIAVGRDGRISGPALSKALRDGIVKAGCSAVDIGCVPSPTSYFAGYALNTNCAVSVTGSHNPPDYNGLKIVLAGKALHGDDIQEIKKRAEAFANAAPAATATAIAPGHHAHADVRAAYVNRIVSDVKTKRKMKIVVDCGNGVAGELAPQVFKAMGCEVDPMFCEIDGNFPNHHPDPSKPENLQDLIKRVKSTDAELGFAFDGDGDRLGVVTKSGAIIYPDRQIMLYAADVLSRNPGATIIYDVKCTRNLAPWIKKHGGVPLMWKTGHSLVKDKLRETGAPLAGEMSGHIFFKERWFGFDDAIYCGARLLEILSGHADPSAVLEALPDSVSTPELNIKCAEGEHVELVRQLIARGKFNGEVERILIDGLRVEFADGFGLARPSNTTPVIVLRFESDTQAGIERIQAEFARQLRAIKPSIELGF